MAAIGRPPRSTAPGAPAEAPSLPSENEAEISQREREAQASVIIDRVQANGTTLRILPKDPRKKPLEFDIHQLSFDRAGPGLPMAYTAVLENALPRHRREGGPSRRRLTR